MRQPRPFASTVPERGDNTLYHHGETNRCPRCGGKSFWVGRYSSECVRCGNVLMFAQVAA